MQEATFLKYLNPNTNYEELKKKQKTKGHNGIAEHGQIIRALQEDDLVSPVSAIYFIHLLGPCHC